MTDSPKDQPVIEVKNLSKKYIISHEQKAEYGSLRDSIMSFIKKPFEKRRQKLGAAETKEEFWALKDVSFTVNKGEIFGVVGRNGSGKSTLLKTLSRIITPTSGEAIIHGNTASLLEVGTGFHPELTGRENVFFNGSMLGMSRDEIGKKFDEIVKFAEIEKFLDTPVKFYSSGMYVRLAFSVAAHLEPDVLILDEVLAVGDASFQEKSMQKILSTIQGGTTVLFVSHGMDTVRKICTRGVLLSHGEVKCEGEIDDIIEAYTGVRPKQDEEFTITPERSGEHNLVVDKVALERSSPRDATSSEQHIKPLRFRVTLSKGAPLSNIRVDMNIFNSENSRLVCASTKSEDVDIRSNEFIFELKNHNLSDGHYSANISVLAGGILEDFYPDCVSFDINNTPHLIDGANETIYLDGKVV